MLRAAALGLPLIGVGLLMLGVDLYWVFFNLMSDSVGLWLLAAGARLSLSSISYTRADPLLRTGAWGCIVTGVVLLPTTFLEMGGWVWVFFAMVEGVAYFFVGAVLLGIAAHCRDTGFAGLGRWWSVAAWASIFVLGGATLVVAPFAEIMDPPDVRMSMGYVMEGPSLRWVDWFFVWLGVASLTHAIAVCVLCTSTTRAAKRPMRRLYRPARDDASCPACRYDLRGREDGAVCPECGTVVSSIDGAATIEPRYGPADGKTWLPPELGANRESNA